MPRELAEQLVGDVGETKIAIIATNPLALLSSIRKFYKQQITRFKRELSSTMDYDKRTRLNNIITTLQKQRFTARPQGLFEGYNVCFMLPEVALKEPPICNKLYVTCQMTTTELYMVTSWMSWGMEAVIYEGRNRCERKRQCFVAGLEAKRQSSRMSIQAFSNKEHLTALLTFNIIYFVDRYRQPFGESHANGSQ
ncbi:MAG: hypothetical protein PVI21_03075 [Candidatus Woesebacteria bacterium]|jgi:hypothetical protein